MFSQEPRCIYRHNQLAEVICQLRFPEILSIGTTVPDKFQEAIRAQFPQYSKRMEAAPPRLTGAPGNFSVQKQEPTVNHQFMSADGTWRVNLTSKFISLACTKYTCWEDFAGKLDKPLAAFIQIYKPAYFERVGLRYVNFISRGELGIPTIPFRNLIEPCYLGLLSQDDLPENACTRSSLDTEVAIRGGCRVKIHTGPGMVQRGAQKDTEVKFIFDQDLYMPGQVPVNLSAGALQTLHSQAFSIFRGAITDQLHDALEPR
jgi:uncharacterized protein (TIGR04255 family)